MDERDGRPVPRGGDGGTGDAGDRAAAIGWTLEWTDLAPADYEAMWRQARAFRELARELRAILHGVHPYADGDG